MRKWLRDCRARARRFDAALRRLGYRLECVEDVYAIFAGDVLIENNLTNRQVAKFINERKDVVGVDDPCNAERKGGIAPAAPTTYDVAATAAKEKRT
jgi:hypothetical protein